MMRNFMIFFSWLFLIMLLLPRIIPFGWIILLDDFFETHGIIIWGSHEFGDERIYDLAANVFIVGSFIITLLLTCLTLLCIRRKTLP